MFDESTETAAPRLPSPFARWFAADVYSADSYLIARWIWLRSLAGIFFSAFLSLYFQIDGLIGPRGLLPAARYLPAVRQALGLRGYWLAPTLLWFSADTAMLHAIVWAGLVASVALALNIWPRAAIAIAGICFLSFVAAAQDFSGYQSDGMLLEAALLSFFFAPRGVRPGLGQSQPPSRASLFMLRWEWFRIYFESGVVKILSGEEQWRNLTAMNKYYENGPLPTFLGWYVQQWPQAFHAATAAATLFIELFLVWLLFAGRRARIVCFLIVTPLQLGIIVTANYAFLNYLVLMLGILLLDDRVFRRNVAVPATPRKPSLAAAIVLPLVFVASISVFLFPSMPILNWPAILVEPFRVANGYGLFAVMTRARYEIEFQGTADGKTWVPYLFRFKPQDVYARPGLYAPYQPRFDWNLWFASLGTWDQNRWVLTTEERLLENEPSVRRLFRNDPFANKPPIAVRAVISQYWFTTPAERARSGAWWHRRPLGAYAPTATRTAEGIVFE
jgi:hypothetical protein